MLPLHLTSKWFYCTIMQHQGLGVHKVIKRFSNYYWSHAEGSMQISSRAEAKGLFFSCFQENKTFSQLVEDQIQTLKKSWELIFDLKMEKLWELIGMQPSVSTSDLFCPPPFFISDFPERCLSYRQATAVGVCQILACKASQLGE